MTNNNTALQVTNFNFYGDELIALKDNTTGEIYTSINSVLRGIGFTDNDQIRKRRDKWKYKFHQLHYLSVQSVHLRKN